MFGSLALFVMCCLVFLPLTSILTQQLFALLRADSLHLDKLTIESRNARGRTVFAGAWVATPLIFLVAPWSDPANLAFLVSSIACIACAIAFSVSIGPRTPSFRPATKPPAANSGWHGVAKAFLLLAIPLLGCGALRAAPRLQQILLGPIVNKEFGGAFSEIGFLSGLTALVELPLILAWGYALRFISRPTMLLMGSLLFSAYFASLYLAPSLPAIYASSLLLALATSGTLSITISYLQNLLPDRPGLGSSLISVANCLGAAIAAITFAPFANHGAFRECAIAAGIVVAIGGLAVRSLATHADRRRQNPGAPDFCGTTALAKGARNLSKD